MKVNPIQELQFELMRKASFNEFDGDLVVDSLLAHRDLWRGVVMDRADYYAAREMERRRCEPMDLIKLRDIDAGYWNVDTVCITAASGKEAQLEALARTWNADEIDWFDNVHAGPYLRVWFD